MRLAWTLSPGGARAAPPLAWALALLLGCTRGAGARPVFADDAREVEVKTGPDAVDPADLAALAQVSREGGVVHWRLRGADGPRCEAWRFEPDAEDPTRGHLAHADGPLRLRFAYQLADDQLRLHAPERERELPAPAIGVTTVALPCVFSGMSFTPDSAAAPRQLLLTSHERWFLTAEACAAAGPDRDPQPPARGELHPLGCASALADPGTRARDDRPTPISPAARRLRAARRVFWLRRRDGRDVCEAWRHEPAADPQRGTLSRSERDLKGRRSRAYGYATTGADITLLGPNEFRRLRDPGGPGELALARGCLLTRPLALAGEALQVGDDRWYLGSAACERARRSGAPPLPDPDCGAPR